MNELHILIAAFVVGAVSLAVLAVLLKRELNAIWSETLNGCARSIK